MISRGATILAITIPLALCLAALLAAVVILFRGRVRSRNQRWQLYDDIEDLQRKLKHFQDLWNPEPFPDMTVSTDELRNSYLIFSGEYTHLEGYIKKWIPHDKTPPPIISDEASRIETVLFPPVTTGPYPGVDNPVLKVFTNPQEYTSTEIATFLRSVHRSRMVRHIIASVLLTNTSVKGCPWYTLLPFDYNAVGGLYNLQNAIRNGLVVGDTIRAYMCRLPFAKAKKTGPVYWERRRYHTLFETLFQPYFKSNSPEDIKERHIDLDKVFAAAVDHGLNVLGSLDEIDYRWGEKKVPPYITVSPAMVESFIWENKRMTKEIFPSRDW